LNDAGITVLFTAVTVETDFDLLKRKFLRGGQLPYYNITINGNAAHKLASL
jgi:hypothetical protein